MSSNPDTHKNAVFFIKIDYNSIMFTVADEKNIELEFVLSTLQQMNICLLTYKINKYQQKIKKQKKINNINNINIKLKLIYYTSK